MTNEVASLGVKVDSSGIESGVKALDALAQQGPKIEQAMAGVEGAAVKTGKSLKTMGDGSAKGLDDVSKAAPKAAEGLGRIAKSAEDATRALAGINASVSSLGQITTAAGQSARGMAGFDASLKASQKSLADMQAQIRVASTAVTQMGSVLTAAVPSMQAAAKAQADAAKSAVDMGAAFKAASDQVRSYSTVAVSASDAGQKAAKSMETTATAARTLTSALAIAGVGFGAQELIGLVDGYGKVTAQLRLATNGASDYAAAMESVRQISRSAQQGLGEVGTLYARIANGTAELGISQRRLSDITEVVALSLRASNATASEASSAMLQLSQAFASGVLRGEEFNAVNEAAPRLMKALADGMGQPIGALRKLAEEGKLTSEVLATALPKALEEVRVEAAKMQTIGGSFTVLKNSMMEFFGTTAQSSGAVTAITKSVELLADNLNLLTAAALGFGATKLAQVMLSAGVSAAKNAADTVLYVTALNQQRAAAISAAEAEATMAAARVSGLATLQAKLAAERQAALTEAASATTTAARTQALMAASVAELNLTRTSTQLTAATAAQTAAQTALSGAITATSTAATVASRALSLVGGPIGLITTALGLGVTAWMAWGSSAESQSDRAKNAIVSVHQDIVSRLDEQIRKLRERAGLLAAGNVAAARDTGPEAEELARLNARIEALKSQGASLAGADQIVLIELQRQYDNLNASLETRKGLQETINGLGVQDRLNALELKKGGFTKEWMEELKTWTDALKAGMKTPEEYAAHVTEMNKARYESTKAGKEEAKQSKANASAAKSEQSTYATLIASIKAKIAEQDAELFSAGKLSESTKLRIKLEAELETGAKKLSAAHKKKAQDLLQELKNREDEEKAIKRAITLNDARLAQDQEIADAQAEMQKRVDAVRLSIYDYSVTVKDSIEMSNLEVQTLGMNAVARNTLIEQLRIEQDLRKRIKAIEDAPYASQEARDADIAKVTAEAMKAKANAQTKAYVSEWEKAYDQSSQALTDALMRGGKNAGEYLKDYFRTLVLRPVIQALVQPVASTIATGVTSTLGLNRGGGTGGSALDLLGAGKSLMGSNSAGGLMGSFNAGMSGGWAGFEGGISMMQNGSALSGAAQALGAAAPYIGGILQMANGNYGAGAGTMAGAYIGSIVPGIGTAVGAVVGSLLGGLLGGKSRGANHAGGVASTATTDRDTAVQQVLGSDSWGNTLGDFTSRANADLDKQLGATVSALSGVYQQLTKFAGGTAREIDIAAGFSVNPKYSDEGAMGYFQLLDKATGEVLQKYKDRELDKDPQKAWATFVGDMGGALVAQLKSADIPGWMRSIFDGLGDEITVDGLNQALTAIAAVDTAFKGWASTLVGFTDLSAAAQTALLNVSGGLEALAGNVNAFYEGYYSENERALKQRELQMQALSGLGLYIDPAQGDEAKELFRKTVEDAMSSGQAELAAKLLAMSGAFAGTADYAQQIIDGISSSAADAAKSAADAAEELARAAKEAAQAAADAAASAVSTSWSSLGTASGWAAQYLGDSSGLQAQMGYVQSSYAGATTVQQREAALGQIIALEQSIYQVDEANRQAAISAAQSQAQALREQLAAVNGLLNASRQLSDFAQSLMLSNQGGMSEADRMRVLRGEYASLLSQAQGGDVEAMSRLQGVTTDYLALARGLSGSGADYSAQAARMAAELGGVGAVQSASAKTQADSLTAAAKQKEEEAAALQKKQFELSGETKKLIALQLEDSAAQFEQELANVQKQIEQGDLNIELLTGLPAELGGVLGATLVPAISSIAEAAMAAASMSASSAEAARAAAASAAAAAMAFASAGVGDVAGLVPQFASGGLHAGGLRLVGERGPELEVTGPARYWSAGQTQAMLGAGSSSTRVESLLTQLVDDNRRQAGEIIRLNARVTKLLERWEGGGLPETREAVTV